MQKLLAGVDDQMGRGTVRKERDVWWGQERIYHLSNMALFMDSGHLNEHLRHEVQPLSAGCDLA